MERMIDQVRGGQVSFVREDETVLDVVQGMCSHKIGAVAVLEAGSRRIRGIFSERDLMTRVVARGLDAGKVLVRDVMTLPVVTAKPGEEFVQCLVKMQAARCRHLPIVEGGELCGMLSLRDVLTAELFRRQSDLEMLELYTWGRTVDHGQLTLVWQCRSCKSEAQGEFPPATCEGCSSEHPEFVLAARRAMPELERAA